MALRALILKFLKQRRRRAYTHIVSLGRNCRPSHQIARHFEFKQSYPFDGWITPLDSAACFIEKLEHDLYNPASLSEWDPKYGWKGTDSLWSQAFDATGARLEPPKMRPIGES